MAFQADRKPVIWAFSVSRLRQVVESVAPMYADRAEVRVFDRSFEEALQATRALAASGEPVDALVAAGANGAYLRDHAPVPVALVDVSTTDALQALAHARTLSHRVGVVNFRRVLPGLDRWKDLLRGLQIAQRCYVTPEEAKAAVAELAAEGYRVVVGPGPACDVAERAGLQAVLLYSLECVGETIERAIEMARLVRAERARREQLASVLDHLDEAVVAVDAKERIVVTNPGFERLVRARAGAGELLGRRLSSVAPELGLAPLLESGAAEGRALQRLGSRSLVVSRTPVRDRGVLAGAVLTCQDASAILHLDRDLRSEHRPRRFIARYQLDGILGTSPAVAAVRELGHRYASTDGTVLITGESGTGKELVAQGIHNASPRRDRPFVAINCASFPESLLESELFGYEEGAFTGSRRGGRAGLFEAAHTGTIFLDEVGDVPLTVQTRLLRVLQERQVLRLGSNDPTPIDVRVIAATNRDLQREIALGTFRIDLYYRLAILPIHVPPLRERAEDLGPLADALLGEALARLGVGHLHRLALPAILPHLRRHDWPGNVRELENVLERVAVLYAHRAAAPERVRDEELAALLPVPARATAPVLLPAHAHAPAHAPPPAAPEPPPPVDLRHARGAREAEVIRRVVEECGGNLTEAARRLGIGRSTLYRKLDRRAR